MKNKRALVLSGGGSKGAFQAGAMKALVRHNRRYDAVFGISVGAINGAYFGQVEKDVQYMVSNKLVEWWKDIDTKSIYKKRLLGPLTMLWKPSLYNAKPLRDLLTEHISTEDVGIPTEVGAVNYNTGKIVYFSREFFPYEKNTWIDAVVASSAFPAFLTPSTVMYPNELWFDGGARDITPLGRAIDKGYEKIDVIATEPEKMKVFTNKKPTAIDIAIRTMSIMSHEIIENDLKICKAYNQLAKEGGNKKFIDLEVIRPDKPLTMNPLKFNPQEIARAIELGEQAARKVMYG